MLYRNKLLYKFESDLSLTVIKKIDEKHYKKENI